MHQHRSRLLIYALTAGAISSVIASANAPAVIPRAADRYPTPHITQPNVRAIVCISGPNDRKPPSKRVVHEYNLITFPYRKLHHRTKRRAVFCNNGPHFNWKKGRTKKW